MLKNWEPAPKKILDILNTAITEHHLPIELPYGKQPHGTPYSIPVPEHGVCRQSKRRTFIGTTPQTRET